MKKIIITVLLIIVVAVAAAAYFLFSNLDGLIKSGIEKYGSEATLTAVRVEQVEFKLTEGSGSIKGLSVANPSGFDSAYAFSMGEVTLGVDLTSLSAEPYIINEVTVRAPQIFIEMNNDNKTNLNELLNNLNKAGAKPKEQATEDSGEDIDAVDDSPEPEPKAQTKSKPTAVKQEKRIIIRSIIFADGNIEATIKPLNNKIYKLKLSNLIMTDLGGKTGATPNELAKEIINRLIEQAKKDLKIKGIDAEINKIKAELNSKVEAEKAKLKSEVETKVEKEKAKLEDKLKGFFK